MSVSGIIDDLVSDGSDEIAELLQSFSAPEDGIDVSVHAVEGRKNPFLFDVEPHVSARELRCMLRDEYGGGDFVVVARKGGKFMSRASLSIRPPQKNGSVRVPAQVHESGSDMLSAVREMLNQSAQQNRELVMAISQRASEQQVDLMKMMLGRDQPQQQMNVIELLAVAEKMFTRKDNSVDLLLRGLDLADRFGSKKESSDSPMADVMKTLGAPLAAIAAGYAAKMGAGEQQAVSEGHNFSERAEGGEDKNENEAGEMNLIQKTMIKTVAGIFLKAAADGLSAEKYAGIFVEQYAQYVPDEFILDAQKFAVVYEQVPEARQYEGWFESVRLEIVKQLFDDTDESSAGV